MLAGNADSFLCNVQMACNICYSIKSAVLFKHDLLEFMNREALAGYNPWCHRVGHDCAARQHGFFIILSVLYT